MGTKGRDLVFWLFALFMVGTILFKSKALFWNAFGCACLLAVYYGIYIQYSIKNSRTKGLQVVVLLPIWPGFSLPYRLMAGRRISGQWQYMYEIHVQGAEPDKFLKQLESDIVLLQSTMAGLFFWETSAPVPANVRRLIREKERCGKAFWVKGVWPIPKAPGTARELIKKHARHGALLYTMKESR